MHLQDARCMNSFSNRSAGRGLYCIVYSFAAKRKDKRTKGRSSVSGMRGISDFRTSFPPAHGKGMLRTLNIRPTTPLKKKTFAKSAICPYWGPRVAYTHTDDNSRSPEYLAILIYHFVLINRNFLYIGPNSPFGPPGTFRLPSQWP